MTQVLVKNLEEELREVRTERMALAMSTVACNPLEHCLFKLFTAVLSGNPATRAAPRNSVAPPPGGNTLPTAMSSTREGSSFERSIKDLKAWTRRSAAGLSLSPPFPPLVKGVRRAQVMTMSSGDLNRIDSRPRGMSASEEARCDWTWERRCCAFDMAEAINLTTYKTSAAQEEKANSEGNRWSFEQRRKMAYFENKPRHGHSGSKFRSALPHEANASTLRYSRCLLQASIYFIFRDIEDNSRQTAR